MEKPARTFWAMFLKAVVFCCEFECHPWCKGTLRAPEGFYLCVRLVSVSVMRRLVAHGFGSRPRGLRGIIQREPPHLQGGFEKGKSEKKV
jgi:hypothetical protein